MVEQHVRDAAETTAFIKRSNKRSRREGRPAIRPLTQREQEIADAGELIVRSYRNSDGTWTSVSLNAPGNSIASNSGLRSRLESQLLVREALGFLPRSRGGRTT